MNTTQPKTLITALVLTCVTFFSFNAAAAGPGHGMPVEARNNIHQLFDNHDKITRKVTMTPDGYVSVTESTDPKLAATLRSHVKEMSQRFESGRMVRGWDPAFRELRTHYADISHRIEATERGLKVIVTGKTPTAIKVAQNHADIVSNFASHGWTEHDVTHPRVSDDREDNASSTTPKACCFANDSAYSEAGSDREQATCCSNGTCKTETKPETKLETK